MKKGFTMVELIVVLTILMILGTIGFVSFSNYGREARNSTRVSDMNNIISSLTSFQLSKGTFPVPTSAVDVTYSGSVAWSQGTFGSGTFQNVEYLNALPLDPLTNSYFAYSVTQDRREYQLGGMLEGDKLGVNAITVINQADAADGLTRKGIAHLKGNYNGTVLKVVTGTRIVILPSPSIIAQDLSVPDLEDIITNKKLVYSATETRPASYEGTDFNSSEFGFSPSIMVLFDGTIDELYTQNSRLILLRTVQESYSGALLDEEIASTRLKGIIQEQVDPLVPSEASIQRSCYLLTDILGLNISCTRERNLFILFPPSGVIPAPEIEEQIFIPPEDPEVPEDPPVSFQGFVLLDFDQIPGKKVQSIYVQDDGTVWFGANGGVARHDSGWTTFTEADGLADNDVRNIIEDIYGNLWFGTTHGVSKYTNPGFLTFTHESDLINYELMNIYDQNATSSAYGFSKSEYFRDVFDINKWSGFNKKSINVPDNQVSVIYQDDDQYVWMGTEKGLYKYTPGTKVWDLYDSSNALPSNKVNDFEDTGDGYIWVGTDAGICRFDVAVSDCDLYNKSSHNLPDNKVTIVYQDPTNGDLWFGTEKGAARNRGGTFTNYLSNNKIRSITKDETSGNMIFMTDKKVIELLVP